MVEHTISFFKVQIITLNAQNKKNLMLNTDENY